MRKITLVFALIAACMVPVSGMAKDVSAGKSSKTSKKNSGKNKEVAVEQPPINTGIVQFTDEQTMLNNEASQATIAGDFQKAEQLYKALLQLGNFNVVWYNIARTYARQNRCMEAFDAFSRVDSANPINSYDPVEIHEAKENGLKELRELCSAQVVLECSPREMTISVDGGAEFACTDEALRLVPGTHSIYARTSFGFNTIVVPVSAGETRHAKVGVVNYESMAAKAGLTVEDLENKSMLFKNLGWSFIAGGSLMMVIGGAVMYVKVAEYKRERNRWSAGQVRYEYLNNLYKDAKYYRNYVGSSILAVGGALALTGAALLVYEQMKVRPQLDELLMMGTRVSPVMTQEFSGIVFSGQF